MNIFNGFELAFNDTYFTTKRRIFKVKTNAPVQILPVSDNEQLGGSFTFPNDDLDFQNRYIIWRSDNFNLYLDEYSATRDLIDSSITINFSQSVIVPGTNFFFYKGTLVLAVPTQSGIHSFCFQLIDNYDPARRLTVNKSIFSLITTNEELSTIHDFYSFKCTAVALKANIIVSKLTGSLIFAVCMTDYQLYCVTLRQFQGNGKGEWEELQLQGSTVFDRFFKGKSADTCDAILVNNYSKEVLIYSIHRDGIIRCWNYKTKSVIFTMNIDSLLVENSNLQISNISIKSSIIIKNGKNLLILKIGIENFTRFILLEQFEKSLQNIFSCEIDTRFVSDFICTPNPNSSCDEYWFWVIVNESCYASENKDIFFQPYNLRKCSFNLANSTDLIWENVECAAYDGKLDSSLFHFPEIDAIRNRIFDGNNYSFLVVSRAIHVTCKQSNKQFEYNNWLSLSNYVDEYLLSGTFKQTYLSFEDSNLLLNFNIKNETKLKDATLRFWQNLLTCCDQLQEDDLKPLGFLHSSNLGIFGVIQVSRYTVYLHPDEHMRTICEPNNKVVKSFFLIIEQFLRVNDDEFLKKINVNKMLETITTFADELCRIVSAFAEHRPIDIKSNLKVTNSEFLSSSFTTGFLAASLRRWIICRLHFADIIEKLISTIPKILATSTEARSNPRLDWIISAYNSSITQIIQCYTVMWIALSVRLSNKDDRSPKQFCVAQAFFKYGGSKLIKRLSTDSELNHKNFEKNVEDEQEIEIIDDDELEASGIIPSSRWDESFDNLKTSISNKSNRSLSQESIASIQFIKFFSEILAGSIITLWPESTTLTLPIFLAEKGFYDALNNYCMLLKEPLVSDLAFALKFFQGISLSGLKDPENAWLIFEEVSKGILSKNAELNEFLIYFYYNENNKEQKKFFSMVEYYNKVMLIFKSHGHSDFVIKAGQRAIDSTTKDDPILIDVFTTLFTQNLNAKNYDKAVQILLFNPDKKLQSVCLRQLLSHLLDNRDYHTLISLSYEHLTEMTGNILETRCRNETSISSIETSYEIAFAFHITRYDFDKAAKIMYDLAQRLSREVQSRELLEKRYKVLAIVFQSLKLTDPGKDVVYCEIEKDERENQFTMDYKGVELFTNNTEHVNLCLGFGDLGAEKEITKMKYVALSREDIGKELIKVDARLQLLDLNASVIPPLQSDEILRELIKIKKYDLAWVIACEFSLPLYSLLEIVTKEAIIIDQNNLFVSDECESLWTESNRQFLSDSVSFKTHWKILISYVDLALTRSPCDSLVLKTVAYTFLKYSIKIPDWLYIRYKKVNFGDFIRTLIDFNELSDAFEYLLPEVENTILKVTAGNLDLLLPFTHIDELLRLSENLEEKPLLFDELKQKLRILFKRYEIVRRGTELIR